MATYIDNTSIFNSAIRGNETANGKTWITVFLLTIFHSITPSHGHIVNDPIEKIKINNNNKKKT